MHLHRPPLAFIVVPLALALGLAGCRELPSDPNADLATTGDLAGRTDGSTTPDLTSLVPSPCPAPPRVTPSDVPSGYLPAITVDLQYVVDGDTADFFFPAGNVIIGKQAVRFLYVNTEESHGNGTTDFGIKTASAVMNMMSGPHKYEVALQSKASAPTQPDQDAFGRYLGLIFVDGTLFQTRLVQEGWSAYYTQFGCAAEPIHSSLLYGEAEANVNHRGIWEAGHPTDYNKVFQTWIGSRTCRPNPYNAPYCK